MHTTTLLNIQGIRHQTAQNRYSHIPKAVWENENIRVLWNQGMQTDRKVLANRTDIITKNKTDKICLLIYVAIPSDRNSKNYNV